ncbi:MAG: UDP-glucose/GDP-mannose dehydrogenase family protein [Gammaproteobacteria bacterium]|nr:MAG: UDP-glucose/GDP-mannose dehydrogenase family protein [Gammaproteobacteria bacterium]
MRISVIGSGYAGLVSGVGLSEVGHNVLCMDIDADRIAALGKGRAEIYEPGLEDMLVENMGRDHLAFTISIEDAVNHAEALMIAVGTPPAEDGSADLDHVLKVAQSVGKFLLRPLLVIVKSTVPVGTCDRVRAEIQAQLDERDVDISFSVASNPEFLAEGAALKNFLQPDRIVCGVEDEYSESMLREMYAPFNRNHEKMIFMDVRSSELTKYSANAMLATKISLMNELANIAERTGADIEQVRKGIGSDPRIGYSFIYAGPGYGGSCFPKDVRALARTAEEHGFDAKVLKAVENVNGYQKTRLFEILKLQFEDELAGRCIAIWGLSFKPRTDDMREAPSRVLIDALLEAGATVRANDPEAMQEALLLYGENENFSVHTKQYDAATGADALVLVTEWKHYWIPDFERLAASMQQRILVDGRNIWPQSAALRHGFTYHAIGRPSVRS